jgi:hypothetical protein
MYSEIIPKFSRLSAAYLAHISLIVIVLDENYADAQDTISARRDYWFRVRPPGYVIASH